MDGAGNVQLRMRDGVPRGWLGEKRKENGARGRRGEGSHEETTEGEEIQLRTKRMAPPGGATSKRPDSLVSCHVFCPQMGTKNTWHLQAAPPVIDQTV